MGQRSLKNIEANLCGNGLHTIVDGQRQCRECRREANRKWREENVEKIRNDQRKAQLKLYGITEDEYNFRLDQQEGVCAICQNESNSGRNLDVDHDHECCPGRKSCGKCIRGLLCYNCNHAIGLLKDSKKYLNRAIEYLERR